MVEAVPAKERANSREEFQSGIWPPSLEPTGLAKDVLRHSYASYWLAINRDPHNLAEIMGNSNCGDKGAVTGGRYRSE